MFIDHISIVVQAGNGGNGCDSYYRRMDRKVVPHGGDGGHGGSVIFRADANVSSLDSFFNRRHFVAQAGVHGASEKKRGRNGENLLILVPPGTQIMDRTRGFLIRHLRRAGEEVVAAAGGQGGHGNQGGRPATHGQKVQEMELELILKILADIFLMGLPNSGKSTFMNQLTRTRLRREDYPFSTRQPEVGVMKISDYESLVLCELPSLYESSHEGRGLGADFLKHLEGARHLLYFLEPASSFAGSLGEGYQILRKQVETYSEDFLNIPHAVVVNKADLISGAGQKKFDPGVPVFYISALSGEGMEKLVKYLGKRVETKHA